MVFCGVNDGKIQHVKSVPIFTEYLSVFSPNAGKCGKNADQNNSEYGLFLRSVYNFIKRDLTWM